MSGSTATSRSVRRRPAETLLVSRHANGERFFQIADAAPPGGGEAPPVGQRRHPLGPVAVARRRRSRQGDRARPSAISSGSRPRGDRADPVRQRRRRAGARAGPTDLVARLRAVRYRGATSLAVLAGEPLTGVDACLLFSDGLVTIDRRDSFQPQCPLFAVVERARCRPCLARVARRAARAARRSTSARGGRRDADPADPPACRA